MEALNLPAIDAKLRRVGDKLQIMDPIRRRFVALTPEEWVRQHFTAYLHTHLGVPQGLIGNEVSLHIGSLQRRVDTVIYDHTARPLAIVEYKAPNIPLSQKVLDQATAYNMVLRVPWLILSNGRTHLCFKLTYSPPACQLLPALPTWGEMKKEELGVRS